MAVGTAAGRIKQAARAAAAPRRARIDPARACRAAPAAAAKQRRVMELDLPALAAVALLAALAVLVAIKRKRAAFRAHVESLTAAARRRRPLVLGRWTRAEVAAHAKADDVWLIIRDKASGEARVYDMSAYVEEHPGGYAILNNAGGDATEGFHGPQHPPTVFDLLGDYYIGPLVDP